MKPDEYDQSYLERLDHFDMTDSECREEWWQCAECGEEYSYERVTPTTTGWVLRCARCAGVEYD